MAEGQLSQCRICLSNCKVTVSISQDLSDGSLADYIRIVTNVNIHPNDGFPQFICFECNKELANCWEFREKAVRSDRILRGADITDFMKLEDEEHLIEHEQGIFTSAVGYDEDKDGNARAKVETKNDFLDDGDDQGVDDIDDTGWNDEVDQVATTQAKPLPKTAAKENQKPRSGAGCGASKQPATGATGKKRVKYITKGFTKCCMCGVQFSRQTELVEHVNETHPNGVEDNKVYTVKHKHKCSFCNRKFWQKQFLMAHYQDVNYVEPKRRDFETKRPKDEQGDRQRYICTYCGKGYSSNQLLSIHEARKHLEDKPYFCDMCDKSFAHPRLLTRHKQDIHSNDVLTCDICNRKFNHRVKLKRHMSVHLEQKRFQCPSCPRSFTYGFILQNHILTNHSAVSKPWPCEICGKAYKWQSDMKKHKMIEHEGKYPFTCQFCGKGYHCSSSKNYHVKRCEHNPNKMF